MSRPPLVRASFDEARRDAETGRFAAKPSLGRTCGSCGVPVHNKLRYCSRDCYAESAKGRLRDPARVHRTHGLSQTPEYRAWQQMRLRCTNPKHRAYAAYGGRGITVCARWLESPENFLADVGPRPSPDHEIDRIDNDRGYEPGNVRWATRSVNDRNRRSNRLLEYKGETLTLAGWAERFPVRADTIGARLQLGWSAEDALTKPVQPKAPNGSRVRRPKAERLAVQLSATARALFDAGLSYAAIGQRLGVSKQTAGRAVKRACTPEAASA